ncbi:MAG TPA: hypothetical protein VD699_00390 [Nitrosopumilaceae archaeon]|nr:hypothetical protein [Nitrosopumilaceae archaeon]
MNHGLSLRLISNFSKIADIVVLVLLVFFFIGLLAFDPEIFGLHEQIITLPKEIEKYFESLPWLIFVVLLADVYLKYKKTRNWKVFVKKHWLDLLMLAINPFFMVLKFMKISLKLFKILKGTKTGIKIMHKLKKITGSSSKE